MLHRIKFRKVRKFLRNPGARKLKYYGYLFGRGIGPGVERWVRGKERKEYKSPCQFCYQ